jgi:hypothetical protein
MEPRTTAVAADDVQVGVTLALTFKAEQYVARRILIRVAIWGRDSLP